MSKLYLLDANAIIAPNNQYFPIRRIPQYWKWLLEQADADMVKIPDEIFQEITPENDDFSNWIKTNKTKLILNEQLDKEIFNKVINEGYEIENGDTSEIKNDAIFIAYAKRKPNRIVVTKEESKPDKKKKNRKIPDVCEKLGIKCINDFEFQEECDFRIP